MASVAPPPKLPAVSHVDTEPAMYSQILEAVSLKKLLVSSTGSDILCPIMLILKLQET